MKGMRKALVIAALVGAGTSAGAEPAKPAAPRKTTPILADFEIRTRPTTAGAGYLTQPVARSGPAVSVHLPGSAWDCISTSVETDGAEEYARLTCFYGDAVSSIRATCTSTGSEVTIAALLSGSQKGTPYMVAVACKGRLVGVPDNLAP